MVGGAADQVMDQVMFDVPELGRKKKDASAKGKIMFFPRFVSFSKSEMVFDSCASSAPPGVICLG